MDQLPFSEDDGQLYFSDFKFTETTHPQQGEVAESVVEPAQQNLDGVHYDLAFPFTVGEELATASDVDKETAIERALATDEFVTRAVAKYRRAQTQE